jgi:hypothetical protein
MSTENISKFLRHYSDADLAGLLAHAQEGKLSYWSCNCLIGCQDSPHALKEEMQYCEDIEHLALARTLPDALLAEYEFRELGETDEQRRERLRPLIIAEQKRREHEKATRLVRERWERLGLNPEAAPITFRGDIENMLEEWEAQCR